MAMQAILSKLRLHGEQALKCRECHKPFEQNMLIEGPSRNRGGYYDFTKEYWHLNCHRPWGFNPPTNDATSTQTTTPTVKLGDSTSWQRDNNNEPIPTTPTNTNDNDTTTPTITDEADLVKRIVAAINATLMPQLQSAVETLDTTIDNNKRDVDTILNSLKSSTVALSTSMDILVKNALALDTRLIALEAAKPVVIHMQDTNGKTNQIHVGVAHKDFPLLVKLAKSLENGQRNIWLSGPAGSGKTTAAKQLAGVIFHDCKCALCAAPSITAYMPEENHYFFTGAIDTEYKLSGFIDANGVIHNTQFKSAWTYGGIFLFDEIDRAMTGALLKFNAALANGYCDFPEGSIKRNVNTYILAAGNTWGFGGSAAYVGANKIDAAFLSRFAIKRFWDYDEDLEHVISGSDDASIQWVDAVQACRKRAASAEAKIVIDPRQSMAGCQLIRAGLLTAEEIKDSVFDYLKEILGAYDEICGPITEWADRNKFKIG